MAPAYTPFCKKMSSSFSALVLLVTLIVFANENRALLVDRVVDRVIAADVLRAMVANVKAPSWNNASKS